MSVLKELLTSKKFLAMLTAIIVYAAGRFGFDVDPSALDRIVAALLVYVGAQGVADAGKSAAQIKAVVATSGVEPEATAAVKRIAASVIMLLVVLGAGGLALSCATTKAAPKAAEHAVIDCGKANAGAVLAAVAEYGAAAIAAGHVDWAAVELEAKAQGATVGGCALTAFLAALSKRPTTIARALTVAELDLVGAGQATLERLRADWGGVSWRSAEP
jgi:hypothetical protein